MPAEWPGYKATLRIEGAEYAIEVDNSGLTGGNVGSITVDGAAAADGRILLEPNSGRHAVRVVLGSFAPATTR